MQETGAAPEVVEQYKGYTPPVDVAKSIRILLRYVPRRYLAGLGMVVLTNSGALSHNMRRQKVKHRGRKIRLKTSRGSYYRPWKGQPARIQIFVDNTLEGMSGRVLRIPPVRELLLGEVLYHEIGHHIHRTSKPEFKEPEDVAEKWGTRLGHDFLVKRYWYLLPLLYPMYFCVELVTKPSKVLRPLTRRFRW
jgi:hypothetical protein